MSDETTETEEEPTETAAESTEDGTVENESPETTAESNDAPAENGDGVKTPEFPDLKPTANRSGAGELNRLYDVEVTVAAELGRTSVPIQKLLGLSEGSVFELNRSISAPIELVAQGIPLGNGEVVVVDDSFAIRIKEIYANPG